MSGARGIGSTDGRGLFEGLSADACLRFFEGLPGACALADHVEDDAGTPDGVLLAVNDAFEHLTGLARTDAVGRTFREAMPGVDMTWLSARTPLQSGATPPEFRVMLPHVGAPVRVRVFPLGDVRFAVVFAEHTAAAETRDALRESRARIESVFRAAPAGIGLTYDRILHEVNERVCEISGYPREELIGRSARMLYTSDEEYERVGRDKYKDIRRVGLGTVETVWRRRDGSTVEVLLSSTPLIEGDMTRGITFTVMDISREKAAEREREELQRQLHQAHRLEALGTMAAGVAHDFNNILTAMVGFTELARTHIADPGPSGNEVATNLNEVLRAGKRARDLVGQILAYARREEGDRTTITLQPVMHEAVALLGRSLPDGVQLDVHVQPDCCPVSADATRVHQVVVNLVTNAIHALTPHRGGAAPPRVELRLGEELVDPASAPELADQPATPHAVLRVRDNGAGMDEETLRRAFDPYFTTKPTGVGTGLGLSIVHGIVKAFDGAIRVTSEPGEGTEFEIFLPSARRPSTRPQDPAAPEIALRGDERILLVDDDRAVALMVRRTLERLGYRVTAHFDPREALTAFETDPAAFDIALLDLSMPGMDGVQLGTALLELAPTLPVVLCTGFSAGLTLQAAQTLGFRGLAQKPLVGRALATCVRETLDSPHPPR